MREDEVFVSGRSKENAQALLAAARAVGEDPQSVRTAEGGYIVSEAIAAHYENPRRRKPPPPQEDEPEPDLGSLSKADLVALAEAADLPTSGTKADLIERLRAADHQTPEGTKSEGTSEDEKE